MQIKSGAHIYTADGDKIGRVKSVVMTPRTQEITDLVIERGFLFTEERLVPMNWVERTNEDGDLILTTGEHDFDDLPLFEETEYVATDENPAVEAGFLPSFYAYGTPGFFPGYYGPYAADVGQMPRYSTRTVENTPDGTVPLQIGADVVTRDDKHVGSVERIFTSSTNNSATHFVIAKGMLSQQHKLVPTDWIERVEEQRVYLTVDSKVIDRMRDFDTSQADAKR